MKIQNEVQNTRSAAGSARFLDYVRRVALSPSGKCLLSLAVVISLFTLPLLTRAQESNDKRTLTGNWMVTVTRVNPPPGVAPTFLSLMTYLNDANFLEESNTSGIRSLHHGNWERTGRQEFSRSSVAFRFDSARNYLGTSRLTATVSLSEDGTEFQANAVIQGFDPGGNLVTTAQSTEVGLRF